MGKIGGLGSGVDALFARKTAVPKSQGNTQNDFPSLPQGITQDKDGKLWADVQHLLPNPYQPRKDFPKEALQELCDSIKVHGVIQPINIQEAGSGNFFIISGERRTRAAKMAGLSKIPVVLGNYTEQAKLEVALIENIQRQDINPIEEALAYRSLMALSGLKQEELASRVGKNRSTVTNALRLLKLSPEIQQAISKGEIFAGHARAILCIDDEDRRQEFFSKIMKEKLTVRQAEVLALEYGKEKNTKKQETKKKDTKKDINICALEQNLIEKLGTKVQIRGSWDKGTLQIDYFSKEDLERLCNLILK